MVMFIFITIFHRRFHIFADLNQKLDIKVSFALIFVRKISIRRSKRTKKI